MRRIILTILASVFCLTGPLRAALPQYDHIVIVIEENHSQQSIIGNTVDAPYINEIANAGANFSNFYAIQHPSQPNYLQLFSGSNQGVQDDNVPSGIPYSSLNLGASLRTAGYSFGGYSQTQPSVGYTGATSGNYARKHNPWVNWQAASPTVNQLPSSVNMPFDGFFPTNFANLPTVSFVVPDQLNDMHDGTVAQGDTWLKNNLKNYIDWAANPANNSLFILTFDEDEHTQNNKIPTLMFGAKVRNGVHSTNWNLHNLLRTVEDMYNLPHAATAANVAPIQGVFTTDRTFGAPDRKFQHGVNSYTSGKDTYIVSGASADTNFANTTPIQVDGDTSGTVSQGLVRFDNIVGNGAGQVPANTPIAYAKLVLRTISTDASGDEMQLHRMITSWEPTSTWNSLIGGVSTTTDAASVPDGILVPEASGMTLTFDVTTTVQGWINGTLPNRGWAVLPTGTDGWRFYSNEYTTDLASRPLLEITFLPEPGSVAMLSAVLLLARRSRRSDR